MAKRPRRNRRAKRNAAPVAAPDGGDDSASGRGRRTERALSGDRRPPNARRPCSNQLRAYPLPFPSHLPKPRTDFLRNVPPYEASFETALKTSYEGFVVDTKQDLARSSHPIDETEIQTALCKHINHCFRYDVTQPFGLGTKCARTYVTRCLLGDPGTTYRYLGVRMFSIPWSSVQPESTDDRCQAKSSSPRSTARACQAIRHLRDSLTHRTRQHLDRLQRIRQERIAESGNPTTSEKSVVHGRAKYDICLVNRMQYSDELKDENRQYKTTVSWHADSSLEHYSTIAVYQTIVPNQNNYSNSNSHSHRQWSVALRVCNDAEGPNASRRGTDIQPDPDIPPLAVSLPSGSTYYLLDDFNHHHQHTVLVWNNSAGDATARNDNDSKQRHERHQNTIRYSCTFRLLRDSHTVQYILQRCQAICTQFHKRGTKLWRSEQLLLTELESEWIRQYHIQGKHSDAAASYWDSHIQQLLRYWSKLECRTKQVYDLLSNAVNADNPKKHKKAHAAVLELVNRENVSSATDIYQSFADLLEERSTMRRLWKKREKDYLYQRDSKPAALPFRFNSNDGTSSSMDAHSPLPEMGLHEMAENLRAMEFRSKPHGFIDDDRHRKDLAWLGWKSGVFALEMQQKWARMLFDGRKTIETRRYALPPIQGNRVAILESPTGIAGKSSLGDVLENRDISITGFCTFSSELIKYTTRQQFEADRKHHCVTEDSGYGWKDGSVIYGWRVLHIEPCTPKYARAVRRMRSLFELVGPKMKQKQKRAESTGNGTRQKIKKRRY